MLLPIKGKSENHLIHIVPAWFIDIGLAPVDQEQEFRSQVAEIAGIPFL